MTILTPNPQPKPRTPGRPFVAIRCQLCKTVSWWGRFAPWECRQCGGEEGRVVNLLAEELRKLRI